MQDINRVTLSGRLTRSGEYLTLQDGTPTYNFTIALTTYRKKGNETLKFSNFFNCEAYGHTAINIQKYTEEGSQIMIDGYLKYKDWQYQKKKYSTVKVIVERVSIFHVPKNITQPLPGIDSQGDDVV